jgi:hypothetical protein
MESMSGALMKRQAVLLVNDMEKNGETKQVTGQYWHYCN